MSQPTRRRRLCDRTGMHHLRPGVQVRITHPRHAYANAKGRIAALEGNRVLVNLGLGVSTWASHRSVEVVKP